MPTHTNFWMLPNEKVQGEEENRFYGWKAIGPTLQNKIGRVALRVGDMLAPELQRKNTWNCSDRHRSILDYYQYKPNDLPSSWSWVFEAVPFFKSLNLVETEFEVNAAIKIGVKKVLAEGAQGSLLEYRFLEAIPMSPAAPRWPLVPAQAWGFHPLPLGRYLEYSRLTLTRVGSGPFPTELFKRGGGNRWERGQWIWLHYWKTKKVRLAWFTGIEIFHHDQWGKPAFYDESWRVK